MGREDFYCPEKRRERKHAFSSGVFSFSRMLCIRWAANASRPVDCDVIPTFHWHSSGLDPIRIIQYGFLGVGAGGVFFGHKEYPSRNIFSYSCYTPPA